MSAIHSLPIQLTSTSPVSGQAKKTEYYSVKPLSVMDSTFSVVLVGYKTSNQLKTVVSTAIINANEFEIPGFVKSNIEIDGYFIINESDLQRQKQILDQLPNGFQLPF